MQKSAQPIDYGCSFTEAGVFQEVILPITGAKHGVAGAIGMAHEIMALRLLSPQKPDGMHRILHVTDQIVHNGAPQLCVGSGIPRLAGQGGIQQNDTAFRPIGEEAIGGQEGKFSRIHLTQDGIKPLRFFQKTGQFLHRKAVGILHHLFCHFHFHLTMLHQ